MGAEFTGSAPGIAPRDNIQFPAHPNTVRLIQKQSTSRWLYIRAMNPFDADLSKITEYAQLETATLKDVTDDYYYGCSSSSGRAVRASIPSPGTGELEA
jgi:hypothetical protein